MSPNQFSDLINGDIDLDFLIQFRDDIDECDQCDFGGLNHKDPRDQISVKPWHYTVDWNKRQ